MTVYKRGGIVIASCAIIVSACLWAFDGVVLTPWVLDLGVTDVPTFVFMLHAVGSIFLGFFLIRNRHELSALTKRDWGSFFLTAFFGGAIGTMAIIAAISTVYEHGLNISVILLLQKLQPLFAILLALLLLKERPKPRFYALALVALVGSFLLTFGFTLPDVTADNMLTPSLLAVLAAFSFGSSTVFSKRAIKKVSHGTGAALRFLLTTGIMAVGIVLISVLASSGVSLPYQGFAGFSSVTWNALGAFVVIALTTGGAAIFIYYWGLKRVLASRSTILEMAFPVSAIVLEYVLHGQLLSTGQWVGAIIVLGAIYAITRTHVQTQEVHEDSSEQISG